MIVAQAVAGAVLAALSVGAKAAAAVALKTAGAGLTGVGAGGAGAAATAAGASLSAAAAAGTVAAGVAGGAAGALASQAFLIATGAQDDLDWKGVGLAALSGGIGAGLGLRAPQAIGKSPLAADVLRATTANALTQGVAVAVGLQDRFDWAGVGVSAISAGVRQAAGWGDGPAGTFAAGVVGVGARSLLDGSSFTRNLQTQLPQIVGETVGAAVTRGETRKAETERRAASEATLRGHMVAARGALSATSPAALARMTDAMRTAAWRGANGMAGLMAAAPRIEERQVVQEAAATNAAPALRLSATGATPEIVLHDDGSHIYTYAFQTNWRGTDEIAGHVTITTPDRDLGLHVVTGSRGGHYVSLVPGDGSIRSDYFFAAEGEFYAHNGSTIRFPERPASEIFGDNAERSFIERGAGTVQGLIDATKAFMADPDGVILRLSLNLAMDVAPGIGQVRATQRQIATAQAVRTWDQGRRDAFANGQRDVWLGRQFGSLGYEAIMMASFGRVGAGRAAALNSSERALTGRGPGIRLDGTGFEVSDSGGRPVSYARPSGYRVGVRDQVWDDAVGASSDGIVRDPLTGRAMSRSEPWDMGHLPGHEFRRLQSDAQADALTRKQFLDIHNDPIIYRPELPSSNRSRALEDMSDIFED